MRWRGEPIDNWVASERRRMNHHGQAPADAKRLGPVALCLVGAGSPGAERLIGGGNGTGQHGWTC
jgi:hypothetical protein